MPFLLATHNHRVRELQSILFYVVKSQDVYCMVTSTRHSQNQKLYSVGMGKGICSLSIDTCSFLEEYTAQMLSSSRPFS